MHTGFVIDSLRIEIHKSRLDFKLGRTVCAIPLKLKQDTQISCALVQEDCTQSESKKYCCVTGPCQQDDILWAELPTRSVGRL